nr:LysR family transcriptional regulator [uncultured Flavobacterium sp.]
MFDFRLKVFTAVAKRLSFTKASEEINISQPAVSKHVRELENELKSKLFDRKGNKIELTIYGQTLLNYAEKVRTVHTILAELQNNQLAIIDIEDLIINRNFYFVTSKGNQSSIVNLFQKFIKNNLKL